jgi:hypothetical protein
MKLGDCPMKLGDEIFELIFIPEPKAPFRP